MLKRGRKSDLITAVVMLESNVFTVGVKRNS